MLKGRRFRSTTLFLSHWSRRAKSGEHNSLGQLVKPDRARWKFSTGTENPNLALLLLAFIYFALYGVFCVVEFWGLKTVLSDGRNAHKSLLNTSQGLSSRITSTDPATPFSPLDSSTEKAPAPVKLIQNLRLAAPSLDIPFVGLERRIRVPKEGYEQQFNP